MHINNVKPKQYLIIDNDLTLPFFNDIENDINKETLERGFFYLELHLKTSTFVKIKIISGGAAEALKNNELQAI